jgi:hypothetical protein
MFQLDRNNSEASSIQELININTGEKFEDRRAPIAIWRAL